MQLLVPGSTHFYRNRLTHSLEVAQIARSIAKRIEEKHYDYNGLDLTLRTLLGVVKYPFSYAENPKKFLYDEDFEIISSWKEKFAISLRTIDCQIMDIADEIAYAAHDLEDALKMGYFTVDDILFEFQISPFNDKYELLKELINNAREFAMKSHTYKTSEEFSILLRKELTSSIVDTLIKDIDLGSNKDVEEITYANHGNLALGLKKLTFNAVKRNPDVIRYEKLGKTVISGLYQVLTDTEFNKDQVLLPAEYRHDGNLTRTVLDYIGGMMDGYAIDQYKVYFGAGGEGQNGCLGPLGVGVPAHVLRDVYPSHVRQLNIHQHDIVAVLLEERDGRCAVGGFIDLGAPVLHQAARNNPV
nr:hypothetical protein [Tanacetum cinerariifolium]